MSDLLGLCFSYTISGLFQPLFLRSFSTSLSNKFVPLLIPFLSFPLLYHFYPRSTVLSSPDPPLQLCIPPTHSSTHLPSQITVPMSFPFSFLILYYAHALPICLWLPPFHQSSSRSSYYQIKFYPSDVDSQKYVYDTPNFLLGTLSCLGSQDSMLSWFFSYLSGCYL